MKGVLPWSVRWTRRAGTRDLYNALAALVSPEQKVFFSSPHTFSLYMSHYSAAWAGSRAGSPAS
jgi:hypothetical protein